MTRNEVHGVDISEAFIDQCNYIKNNLNIKNFYPQHVKNNTLPFDDNTFDLILIFDVVHHLEKIDENFSEIKRVLKKNGKIIVYEPNKLNTNMLLHLSSYERGLLSLGTKTKYKQINRHNFTMLNFIVALL